MDIDKTSGFSLRRCAFAAIRLAGEGMRVIPIYSFHVQNMDTRFGSAEEFRTDMEEITGEKGIFTIQQAVSFCSLPIIRHLFLINLNKIQ